MLESKKHVFWQAFFVTVLFFLVGLVLGVYLEQLRSDEVNILLYDSETSLYDSFALEALISDDLISCEDVNNAIVKFADQVFEEAKSLEKYDQSSKLTDSLKSIHRKYDLLRTLLWINIISAKENCENLNTVVYFYIYDSEEIKTKAEQITWGRLLEDLKDEMGSEIILIPIAVDQNINSLDYLLNKYDIGKFPSVLINEENLIEDHKNIDELKEYFN